MTTGPQDEERVAEQESQGGATFAAGALLLTSALLTFFVGVFAFAAHDLVVSGPGYEFTFQTTGWGWANTLTAVVLAAAAVAVFVGAPWARAATIVVTSLAIVVTFLWMPYYPAGSIVLIALDVVVVWGVAAWNTSRRAA